ncbi:hypothetical protein GWK41_04545 [Persephonella atlantica]|uniref:Uncharacterized protein n=1 Tax=Persephonella atlantica TaxID=2699429 RepID=A0ABS1GHD3_9AQUI|nr:hypothetical protein [Persephonella atlantica]MBK3332335.1 hypothetical protein [Persephonella atlantica]
MEIKLTGISALLEVTAVFFLSMGFYESIILFLILHGIATVLLSSVVWIFIPGRYKKPLLQSFIAINVVLYVTPVLSYLALFVFIIILRKQKKLPVIPLETVPVFGLIDENIQTHRRRFGESSVREFVLKRDIPKNLRLRAFLFLTEMASPESVKLLKNGLQDPDDEIRLLSFSVLDRIEKKISEEIHRNLEKLSYVKDKNKIAGIYAELARLYWENVYMGVADAEIVDFYLEQSKKYAEKAYRVIKEDPYLDLLLGRIYLIKGNTEKASYHLSKALNSGIPEFKVAPYLAELYFRTGRFTEIKKLIKAHRYLKYDPFFYPVFLLWEE